VKKKRQKWLEKKRRKNEKKRVERNKKNKKGDTKAKEEAPSWINLAMFRSRQRVKMERRKEKAREMGSGIKVISGQEHTQKGPESQPAKTIQSS
jgi:hypothetical protein